MWRSYFPPNDKKYKTMARRHSSLEWVITDQAETTTLLILTDINEIPEILLATFFNAVYNHSYDFAISSCPTVQF